MAKPTPLSPETMQTTEPEKTLKPREIGAKQQGKADKIKKTQDDQTPLQIRIPKSEVKAIKLAALNADQTISDFMLECFHACMQK